MKPLTEIIESHTREDGNLDLVAATLELIGILKDDECPILSASGTVEAFIASQDKVNGYLGHLILMIAAEVGALPLGYKEEMETLKSFLVWASVSALYEAKLEVKTVTAGHLTLVDENYNAADYPTMPLPFEEEEEPPRVAE